LPSGIVERQYGQILLSQQLRRYSCSVTAIGAPYSLGIEASYFKQINQLEFIVVSFLSPRLPTPRSTITDLFDARILVIHGRTAPEGLGWFE
jgi:hypothetical protein